MAFDFCMSALSNSVGTLIMDWVAKPIGHQLNYIRRFRDNVEMLTGKKNELMMARARLQREVEEAANQLKEIEDDVSVLLSKEAEILSDIATLENKMQQKTRWFNWCWRYQLSKKAMKNTLLICELLEKNAKFGQPGRVGYHSTTTIPTIEFLLSKDFMVSKSSKTAFNQIIEALNDDNVSIVGLWGMGGVGKTTLVREVGNQAKKLNLFDKVVISTVSQKPNIEAIQDEIAKYLSFDMKNERGRRSRQDLWLRLQKEKRILIILDDVWAKIDLKEEIGIPFADDHKGCRILLTTRRQQVCVAMQCQKAIPIGCLDEHEAWTLFSMKAGLSNSSDDAINHVAAKVVKKCEGLPIAIVTLGSALKSKNFDRWKAAYRRLQSHRLADIDDINQQNAYRCLEVSFEYLKDSETKICFLLCSLFPEDYEICVEDIVRYAWGLKLHKGMDSIEDVRSEVLSSIDILKESSLLLNCGERHVKMHDMVRGVALWIASDKKEISFKIKSEVVEMWPKNESLEPYVAISFNTSPIVELPKGLVCPNLKILLLGGDGNLLTSSEFFEGMKALNVCALHSRLIPSNAFRFQTNLRTLHLERCKLLDISVVGKLETLQVLSLSRSDITELPEVMGDLNNLKLLDLSYCAQLQRIPPLLMQRLSKLEELYLHGCGLIKWVTENTIQEQSCASLSELNSLSYLSALSLEVSSRHLPRDFVFRRLRRFYVCIYEGVVRPRNYFGPFDRKDSEICPLSRSLKIEASVFEACKQLIGDTASLNLKNVAGCQNLVPSLELDDVVFNQLTSLGLESCEHMKCLIDTTKQPALTIAFSNLSEFSLKDMGGLEELCSGDKPQGFLVKLKTLLIHNCKQMRCSIPILQNLERLDVLFCGKMEVLFESVDLRRIQEGPSHHVSLQSLKAVSIYGCNKLRYLFPTSVAKSLEQLETLEIFECLELEEIIPKTEASNISLQRLREVTVGGCKRLASLSSLSHGQRLENLTTLYIWGCPGLEYTFPISMADGLPQLTVVTLRDLARLKGRDGNEVTLTLPTLKELKVDKCPQLTPFIISAKIKELHLQGMREKKQMTSNVMDPGVKESSSNMEYLTISNFEELFDDGYNLSSLKVLQLVDLPELRVLWKDPIQVESFQNLTNLHVDSCKRLRYILSPTIARKLPQLSSLWIHGCSELEGIIEKDDQTSSQHHHHLQPIRFRNLSQIWIERCENLKSLFPISVSQGLSKLQALTVMDVSRLEQVFEQGDEEDVSNCQEKMIQLPQLATLNLTRLPRLVSFIPVGYHFVFPSLRDLKVEDCPNTKTSFRLDDVQQTWHAKTEAGRSIDKSTVEESATAQETIGSNISAPIGDNQWRSVEVLCDSRIGGGGQWVEFSSRVQSAKDKREI